MSFFGRVLTAMVTPFDEAANVDYPQAAALAKRLADSGSDGIVVAGTTGESPTLTDEEKIRLFGTVKEAVAGRAVVVAGTGTNDTRHSIHLTKDAGRAGADAYLLVNPYYNRPSQDGLYAHFRAIAESTGDRKSTRLNSSHSQISYAVFCLKKKKHIPPRNTMPT